jgi:hypothetical protein
MVLFSAGCAGPKYLVKNEPGSLLHHLEKERGTVEFAGTWQQSGTWLGHPSDGGSVEISAGTTAPMMKAVRKNAKGVVEGAADGYVVDDVLYLGWAPSTEKADFLVLDFSSTTEFQGASAMMGRALTGLYDNVGGGSGKPPQGRPTPELAEHKHLAYRFGLVQLGDYAKQSFGSLDFSRTGARWNLMSSPEEHSDDNFVSKEHGVGMLVGTRMYVALSTFMNDSDKPSRVGVSAYRLVDGALEGSQTWASIPFMGQTLDSGAVATPDHLTHAGAPAATPAVVPAGN